MKIIGLDMLEETNDTRFCKAKDPMDLLVLMTQDEYNKLIVGNKINIDNEELSRCISSLKNFDGHITIVRQMGKPLTVKTPDFFDESVEIAIKILEKLEKHLKGE